MENDQHPKNNQSKLDSTFNEPQRIEKRPCTLNKLIILICASSIVFIGINFVNCSFMIPGSIEKSYVLGGLKNKPSLSCDEAQRGGFNALITLLTTVIALKTKFD